MQKQDVVVALKLHLMPKWLGYAWLGLNLDMSLSQAHRSVQRLRDGRLLVEEEMRVQRENLARFVVHGLPHVFRARLGEFVRGVPTTWACPLLANSRLQDSATEDLPPVWRDQEGT